MNPRRLLFAPLLLASGACEQAIPLAQSTFERLASAPAHVAIQGDRLHTVETPIGLQTAEDRITTDGAGGIDLVLLAWNGLSEDDFAAMGQAAQWDAHLVEYHNRRRFTTRFRDFAIADPDDAARNYEIQLDPNPQSFLNRSAARAVFVNRHSGRSYEILFDLQTSVVLVVVERDASGVEVSKTEYLSFAIVPDPAPILDTPLQKVPAPEGFAPMLLPLGYRHAEAWGLPDPPGEDLRVDRYTDGIDHLFVVQRPGPQRSVAAPVEVRNVLLGAVRIVEADAVGKTFSVIGRLPVDDLLPVLGSLSQ
jgi:hypothetical protein